MRILLSDKSRGEVFEFLKRRYDTKSYKELSIKLNIPFKTLQKWRLGVYHIPSKIIPDDFKNLEILDEKEDNWAQVKGGLGGMEKKIAHLKKMRQSGKYLEVQNLSGRNAIKRLRERYGKDLIKMILAGKIRKRVKLSKDLEFESESFFTNEQVNLDSSGVVFTKYDKLKEILFPKEMSVELAEEIGVHLGDGCLSYNRNYFSVKTNKKEEDYMVDFLFPLYKKLYNLNLKLMRLPSVVGFEVYSSALFQFKNEVLQIPYGNKVEKIRVPKVILETKNKEIYRSFIRGVFDTDGCVHLVKSKNNYPVISFTIRSKKFIEQVKDMLIKLGFIPYASRWAISLNGQVMLEKWIKEIGSNTPKNLRKLERARSIVG